MKRPPAPAPGASEKATRRYHCHWRSKEELQAAVALGKPIPPHYWVDTRPTEPHWPDSAVMRWDLRQKDWQLIWPELIDHPCALLFAPTHPLREGPRRFSDWVRSWPGRYSWETDLPPHLHDKVRETLAQIEVSISTPGSRPEDEAFAATEPQEQVNDVSELMERLAAALLDVDGDRRPAIAQALSTLAMAPDSGRTLQFLQREMARQDP